MNTENIIKPLKIIVAQGTAQDIALVKQALLAFYPAREVESMLEKAKPSLNTSIENTIKNWTGKNYPNLTYFADLIDKKLQAEKNLVEINNAFTTIKEILDKFAKQDSIVKQLLG